MPDEILLNEAAYAVWKTVQKAGPMGSSLARSQRKRVSTRPKFPPLHRTPLRMVASISHEYDREQIVVSRWRQEN